MAGSSGSEYVRVRRRDLERLTTEVMQMRDFLPQILNHELIDNVQRLEQMESALEGKDLDCEHFRARLEAAQNECAQEREEKLSLLAQLSGLRELSVQQADYYSHLGAVVCTLLWGTSNQEEVVRSILGGGKASMFFGLASHTVSSFVESIGDELPQNDECEESHFLLGLAGTITNVAAVSCGRDFLVTSCRDLLDTWIHVLGQIKLGTCSRLRVLILMSLYNVSINRMGLSWMSNNHEFISQLQRLLMDPDPEVCLQTLRLFQSVVMEPDVLCRLKGDLQESLLRIQELSQSPNPEVQSVACDILEETRGLETQG
ncbi:heat shock factor 2-binding protein [Rhinophrynus dorsalis]